MTSGPVDAASSVDVDFPTYRSGKLTIHIDHRILKHTH